MSRVLFELSHRGDVWQLAVVEYRGRTSGDFRKWYWDGDNLKPGREGVSIPLGRLPELYEAIGAYLAENPPQEA